MADNRTAQLLPASFKGVSFSVRSESSSDIGRKLILHEYVNSSERFVEDQGQIPPKFSVRAFVHGEDFIARAARLEQALNEEGSGRLSLPVFGVSTVFAGAYSKDASQQSVGEITYTIPFFAGRPAPGPTAARSAIQDVYQAGDDARAAVEEAFADLYIAPDTSVNSIAAIGDLNNITENIENAIKSILPSDELGSVFRLIDTSNLNAAKLVRDPSSLGSLMFSGSKEIPGIWQQISLGLSQSQSLGLGIEQLLLLTNLGGGLSLSINAVNRAIAVTPNSSDIALWPETTRQRIERNNSRKAISQANRVASLVGVYEVAAGKSYTTDDEIVAVRNNLEDIHERIMREETVDNTLIQSNPDVRNSVEIMRLAALDVIGQKEQSAFDIITDESGSPTSALVRSYLLYSEEFTNVDQLTDRSELLASLNVDQSSAALVNQFKIFQV